MTFNQICGLPEMTLEEELSLPENMMATKKSKIEIMSRCSSISRALSQIEFRARTAPMEDNQRHAELMTEFAEIVKAAEKAMWDAAGYGII